MDDVNGCALGMMYGLGVVLLLFAAIVVVVVVADL